MRVTIVSGKEGARKDTVELAESAMLTDLQRAYLPRVNSNRKAFKVAGTHPETKKPVVITLDAKRSLHEQGVRDGSQITYKDLGPQVGYRTVFLVEYAGPLAIMAFYAMRPSFLYGSAASKPYGYTQRLFISLFAAHFIKRELESIFVHKFSHPTMPMRNIFKNCIYYWSFAAFIGYVLCSPRYTETSRTVSNIGAALMILFELLNGAVHIQLSSMRTSDGDQARRVPTGPLFALLSCPNYFFEFMSWVSFSIGTGMISSWMFTAAGLLQMGEWAVKKHRNYIKTDPSVKKKKSILPFII